MGIQEGQQFRKCSSLIKNINVLIEPVIEVHPARMQDLVTQLFERVLGHHLFIGAILSDLIARVQAKIYISIELDCEGGLLECVPHFQRFEPFVEFLVVLLIKSQTISQAKDEIRKQKDIAKVIKQKNSKKQWRLIQTLLGSNVASTASASSK
ncbi:unnamed protein product [Acanthoscelides obtectus]|uniref:Uncharacterized protein n=1 Tax=Acanthoscelides obtectus TaxID=200917 RepID=A0A9P0LLK6_ACAOB|nr:unnamed protein product [Acanthoscelides obtectus]CAK1668361.1 hypothetical protein AOBTE_LOCUS26353 [Acanthoscelides obtectus]